MELGERLLRALPDAHPRRHRGARAQGLRGARSSGTCRSSRAASGPARWCSPSRRRAPTSSAVRTRAVQQGDGSYLLEGQKIFITYGEHDLAANIVHLVLARTPDAPRGREGHLALRRAEVPRRTPTGASARATTSAACRSSTSSASTRARRRCSRSATRSGAVGWLVGEENRGLEYMFITMNAARYSVGLEGIGIAERAYQAARRVRARADPGHRARHAEQGEGADPPPPRRAAHAAPHEVAHRGDARDRVRHRRGGGHRPLPPRRRPARRGARRSSSS